MDSFRNTTSASKWCNLPSDILLPISKKLDGKYDRQLAAVCTSWNSYFPKSPSNSHSSFPIEIPCPVIPTLENKKHVSSLSKRFSFWVIERSVVLISPLKKEPETPGPLIAKVEESGLKKRSLINPLTGIRISPYRIFRYQDNSETTFFPNYINLLDFCVTDITKGYTILWVDRKGSYHTHSCNPTELYEYLHILKVITFHVDEEGITILVLCVDGKLVSWKSGWKKWKMVDSLQLHNCKFVDIICFDGKFCAVDLQGNLIMIDPLTVEPIKSVAKPPHRGYDYIAAYLVQCDEYLYLVKIASSEDSDDDFFDGIDAPVRMFCFVLFEEHWVANKGFGPSKSHIFFMGNDVTYSLSAKLLGLPRGNVAYHGGMLVRSFCVSKNFDLFVDMNVRKSSTHFFHEDVSHRFVRIYDYKDRSFTNFVLYRGHFFDVFQIFLPVRSKFYEFFYKYVISKFVELY